MSGSRDATDRPETRVCHAGLAPERNHGVVNPPVYHASTVLFPDLATLEARAKAPYDGVYYGRYGTPTTFAFEEAVAELEGGYRAVTVSSGLAAITMALSSFARSGDHVLIADTVYAPTRTFCDQVLAGYGVAVEYYDPWIGAGIAELVRPTTSVLFLESPGSLTFEIQDVPALATAVRAAAQALGNARMPAVMIDNTWATPLFFKPFAHGCDVSVHAATKYLVGHSDACLGMIVCSESSYLPVKRTVSRYGVAAGPDDVYLALRGLRTLAVRLARHQTTGLALADWLSVQPEVTRVLHPARPGDPGYALWQRDFTGACGLFAVVLTPCPPAAVAALIDSLRLFGIGYSWGGFESLVVPAEPAKLRTAVPWQDPGPVIRFHAGLEDPADLIADLARGFAALRAVTGR